MTPVGAVDTVIWLTQFASALGTVWLFCLMVAYHWVEPVPRHRSQWGEFLLDTALCLMFFIVVVRQFFFDVPPLPDWVIALTACAVIASDVGYWLRKHPRGRPRLPLLRRPGRRRHSTPQP